MGKINKDQIKLWREFITVHARIIENIERDLREKKAIPLNWYDVLFALWEIPKNRATPKELASSVILSKSTLTRILDRLEENHYILRERSKSDGRSSEIVLTADGISAMKIAWPLYAHRIQTDFISKIKPEEQNQLGKILSRVI